jgi:hypothetical protein
MDRYSFLRAQTTLAIGVLITVPWRRARRDFGSNESLVARQRPEHDDDAVLNGVVYDFLSSLTK